MQREEIEQSLVFKWAELQGYPELELMFHVPNGGKRDAKTAMYLKMAGVKAGVPDILLLCPSKDYHGLAIEMKVKPNKLTEAQTQWLKRLEDRGYKTAVCWSAEEAIKTIKAYLR